MSKLTFEEFARGNHLRCGETFKREVVRSNVIAFALGLGEETGEVLGKVRACEGITKRKAGTSEEDVAMEIGDVLAYLDLVAQAYGFTLEYCAQTKYNIVSERSGSAYRFVNGQLIRQVDFKDVG